MYVHLSLKRESTFHFLIMIHNGKTFEAMWTNLQALAIHAKWWSSL